MILSLNDLMRFYDCSKPTALKRKREINEALKKKSKNILLIHLAKYEGIKENDVLEIMMEKEKKRKHLQFR